MLVDIDIIMKVFMKNLHTKCLKIGGERPQLKVPMKALWECSPFLYFSLGEEIQPSRDRVDTIRGFKKSIKETM